MINEHDSDIFSNEVSPQSFKESDEWKILIVDDEENIHRITRLMLKDNIIEGKRICFLNAFSSEECRRILAENDDIALILLDVVMETNTSGFELVRYIRDELKNSTVRIILVTGYPAEAPEKETVLYYDINDYKVKTELTANRLFFAVNSALRTFRMLRAIELYNRNLEQKIEERTSELKKTNERYYSECGDGCVFQFCEQCMERKTRIQ